MKSRKRAAASPRPATVPGVLLLCALLLAGCAGEVPDAPAVSDEQPTAETQQAVDAADPPYVELGQDLYSFHVRVDGYVYALPAALGRFLGQGWVLDADPRTELDPGEYVNALLQKDGTALRVQLANNGAAPALLAGCVVAGLQLALGENPGLDFALPGELALGTNRAAVLLAPAVPDVTVPDAAEAEMAAAPQLSYTAGRNAWLRLGFEGDTLADVSLWSLYAVVPSPAPETLPDTVRAYTAPTQLGQNWQSFNILYAGQLYTLPAPVAAFLENGWMLRDEGVLEPDRWVMRICLQKGNQVLRTTLHNYSEAPQPLSGCFVTMVEWARSSADIPLVLPGDIGPGSSYDDVVAAYGLPHATDRYGQQTWDIIYKTDDGQLVFRFLWEDDTLCDLEVWNHPAALRL